MITRDKEFAKMSYPSNKIKQKIFKLRYPIYTCGRAFFLVGFPTLREGMRSRFLIKGKKKKENTKHEEEEEEALKFQN